MYVIGLGVFIVASFLVGAAQSSEWLVAARTLQGFGAAVLAPSTLALLSTNFPVGVERTRGRFVLGVSFVGLAWRSRASADSSYLAAVALPTVLIGGGQVCVLGPMTNSAMTDVEPRDAGAASGVVNVAHQLGGSLGLAVLVAVFAAANASGLGNQQLLAHRIFVALRVGAGMLAVSFVLVLALIVRKCSKGTRK